MNHKKENIESCDCVFCTNGISNGLYSNDGTYKPLTEDEEKELVKKQNEQIKVQLDMSLAYVEQIILESGLTLDDKAKRVFAIVIADSFNAGFTDGVAKGITIGIKQKGGISNINNDVMNN